MKQANLACFIIALLGAYCLPFLASAQKWAPVGTKWVYTQLAPFSAAESPSEWNVVDTITIKDKLCTIIQSKGNPFDTISSYNRTMITYEDSGVVYWYRPILKGFTVLYDFNKKVGESWDIEGLEAVIDTTKCSIKMTVVEVGLDTINGIALRTMLTESFPLSFTFGGKIIEFIGNLSNIRPNPCFVCRPITENYDIYGLRCFENDSIGFHDFKIVPDCYYSKTNINEIKNENLVLLAPNPISNVLTVASKKQGLISVFNLMGRAVFQGEVKEDTPMYINTINWASGIYWYRVNFQNENPSYGKLIKQ